MIIINMLMHLLLILKIKKNMNGKCALLLCNVENKLIPLEHTRDTIK